MAFPFLLDFHFINTSSYQTACFCFYIINTPACQITYFQFYLVSTSTRWFVYFWFCLSSIWLIQYFKPRIFLILLGVYLIKTLSILKNILLLTWRFNFSNFFFLCDRTTSPCLNKQLLIQHHVWARWSLKIKHVEECCLILLFATMKKE